MKSLFTTISTIAVLTILFGLYSKKFIWVIIGLVPIVILALITFIKSRNRFAKDLAEMNSVVEQLKATGERISVDFDNCEIKDSSYSQDIIDERMTRMSDINFDYGKVIGKEFTGQSLLIYNHSNGSGTERFVQAFPFGAETLKVYVIRQLVILYVDRINRSRYYFDLKAN